MELELGNRFNVGFVDRDSEGWEAGAGWSCCTKRCSICGGVRSADGIVELIERFCKWSESVPPSLFVDGDISSIAVVLQEVWSHPVNKAASGTQGGLQISHGSFCREYPSATWDLERNHNLWKQNLQMDREITRHAESSLIYNGKWLN